MTPASEFAPTPNAEPRKRTPSVQGGSLPATTDNHPRQRSAGSDGLGKENAVARERQMLLGTVAPKRTAAQARFEAETIRRGGPFEVQGKSQRARAVALKRLRPEISSDVAAMMPRLKRMP